MTFPFDPNSLFTLDGTSDQIDFGQTGQAGGGVAPVSTTPIPTPASTPITCESLGLRECGFFELNTDSECGPGSTCQPYAGNIFCCTPTQSPPTPTPAPLPPSVCTYTDEAPPCSQLPGFAQYTGIATRKVLNKDANGNPLPLNCVPDSTVTAEQLDWNTAQCIPPRCVYKTETQSCNIAKNETGWVGSATRQVIDTAKSNPNCIEDTAIGAVGPWNVSTCTRQTYSTTVVATPTGGGLVRGRTANNTTRQTSFVPSTTIVATLGESTFFEAQETSGYTFAGWFLNGALWSTDRAPGILSSTNATYEARFTPIPVTQTCTCYFVAPTVPRQSFQVRYQKCGSSQTVTETFTTFTNICSANIPAPIQNAQVPQSLGTDCTNNPEICSPSVQIDSPSDGPPIPIVCTPPTKLTRNIAIACTSISNNFSGGTANQVQVARYDGTATGPGECPYTWENSGTPDTSTCQLINIPTTCTPPTGPSTREVLLVCSQVDSKFTSGQAVQRQVRRVDTTKPGPGECPYVWENSGTPDVASCITPVFWKNCVSGELIEGTPPSNFQSTEFLGAGGGICWEPVVDLGFEPSLTEALRYTYQRGSSNIPSGKDIKVTNSSYGSAYKVTITTNPTVGLAKRNSAGSKGTLSFTIAPRSSEIFTVTITQELLQTLQDGLSSLSMAVEYQQVIS